MNIDGLDYNTQRGKLVMPEYGREIQEMVDHAISLEDREERQRCAETIITIMQRMFPKGQESADYMQRLWDQLAIMSNFKLDIDYPFEVTDANTIATKPDTIDYPSERIPVRHYGKMMFELFDQLKTMEPGEERDALVKATANQMKRNLAAWSHGSCDDEKVASDLARFTDGVIQLDLDTFKFEKVVARTESPVKNKNKKK